MRRLSGRAMLAGWEYDSRRDCLTRDLGGGLREFLYRGSSTFRDTWAGKGDGSELRSREGARALRDAADALSPRALLDEVLEA